MTERPTVVLFGGWFGSRNAGDEAIMIGNVAIIRRFIPQARILVHSIDPDFTESMSDVEAISVSEFRTKISKAIHLIRTYRSADLFVVTGGTPIFDFRLLSRLFHFGVPLLSSVPIVWLGIGMKPIKSRMGRAFYSLILRFSSYVSVRDPEVHQGLRGIGYKGNIELTADSAIVMPTTNDVEQDLPIQVREAIRQPFIAFTPIFLSAEDPDSHYHEAVSEIEIERAYTAMARVADVAVEGGYQAIFVPMHKVQPDDDRVAIDIVRRRMNRDSKVLDFGEHPRLTSEVISRAHLLVGMRLHSLVLATARSTPAVGIAFDMKVGGYMRYVGLGEYVRPISTLDENWLLDAYVRLLSKRDEVSRELEARIAEWTDLVIRSCGNALRAGGLLDADRTE
jgi:polysaccharide pyruvyl transferase WcaK-like protein